MPLNISFNLQEMLSFLGLVQCVYIIVHIMLGRGFRAYIPVMYFAILGAAFFIDTFAGILGAQSLSSDVVWFALPPMAAVLIVRLDHHKQGKEKIYDFWPAFAYLLLIIASQFFGKTSAQWVELFGFMIGCTALASLWGSRSLFKGLQQGAKGVQRYWIAISLIAANVALLGIVLADIALVIEADDFSIIRTILGLSFVYLVMTSVLRIYPKDKKASLYSKVKLSDEEEEISKKVKELLEIDKVYHEYSYSRKDMAIEVGTSEARLSKIISVKFGQSLPRLLNNKRVEDAKRLLVQTNETIQVIAREVGFNSLASFNRAFKEKEGISPSAFRSQGLVK